jgi:hypothetical protein
VVVATHPAGKKKSPVGVTCAGVVYELFGTLPPQHAFTACDVVELYLHRGAFELPLSDEDLEIDPDRWCSHAAWGEARLHAAGTTATHRGEAAARITWPEQLRTGGPVTGTTGALICSRGPSG